MIKEIFEYEGTVYKMEHDSHSKRCIFRVEGQTPSNYHKTLSKYYPISEYSIDAIEKNHFYLPQPSQQNDLFDFSPYLFDFRGLSLEKAKKILWRDYSEDFINDRYNKSYDEFIEEIKNTIYLIAISKMSSISLTPNKYSDLMWGYYSNHEGFLIEFDCSKILGTQETRFHGPFPVNYVKKLRTLSINEVPPTLLYFIQMNVKKNDWRHEDEYRFLVESDKSYEVSGDYSNSDLGIKLCPRLENYPISAVLGVYLGYKFKEGENWNRDEKILTLNSTKKELKQRLLDCILRNGYKAYTVSQNPREFSLVRKTMDIEPVNDFQYRINTYIECASPLS